jgi:hypothetical protein
MISIYRSEVSDLSLVERRELMKAVFERMRSQRMRLLLRYLAIPWANACLICVAAVKCLPIVRANRPNDLPAILNHIIDDTSLWYTVWTVIAMVGGGIAGAYAYTRCIREQIRIVRGNGIEAPPPAT